MATTLTAAVALVAIVDFVVVLKLRAFLNDVTSGSWRRAESRERAADLENVGTVLQISSAVFIVAAAVAWMVWLWAARRNAATLSGPFRMAQGWVIGAWLIPIVNLWFPKQLVQETWLATERFLASPDAPRPRRPLLVYAWWLAFVTYLVLSRVLRAMSDDSVDDLLRLATVQQVFDGVCVLAAALGVAVIWHITRRQEAAARQLRHTAMVTPS